MSRRKKYKLKFAKEHNGYLNNHEVYYETFEEALLHAKSLREFIGLVKIYDEFEQIIHCNDHEHNTYA